MILITGATGTNGSELTKLLSGREVSVRAMVRSRTKAARIPALSGVEIVEGDFDDPASLENAMRGVQKAFLLTNSSERAEAQQCAFVDTAQRVGVKHIVKLSQLGADPASPVRFLRYHAVVERRIEESGMAYTFLRPNLYMQGLLAFRASIAADGKFFAAAGDNAAAAAAALTESGHEGKTYVLTGPESLTHAELAATLSQSLGKPISFVNVSSEAMRAALLQAGFPVWQADGLIEDYAHYRRGEASTVTSGVQDATGKAPRTFAAFAHDFAAAFA